MDLDLDSDQQAILDAVETLLARHAGPQRAIELARDARYDHELERALAEAGFLAIAEATGPLEAALVAERVAARAGVVAIGAQTLVAPALLGSAAEVPLAIARAGQRGPLRFGAHARLLLLDCGDEARRIELDPAAARPVRSNFGFPFGEIALDPRAGTSLGPGSGAKLRAWWRLALAAELVGGMGAALDVTVDYVKKRRQFGRAIGSFQALQHRLAHCAVLREGARWLVLEAAAHGAPADEAAVAAAYAASAADRLFVETHQMSGAMGFTREHDLHVWSMRLQALRLEAGGVDGHRRAVAEARWLGGAEKRP